MSNNKTRAGMPKKPAFNPKLLFRVVKMLYHDYPVLVPLNALCILFAALVSAIPAVFIQKITAVIEIYVKTGDYSAARVELIPSILFLLILYVVSIIAITVDTQLSAYITQGFLSKMRIRMFNGMQNLPIKYFDTHKHGDIMSYYTNDIDTLRELISRSIPTLIRAGVIVLTVFGIMVYYSVWLTLIPRTLAQFAGKEHC